MALRVEWVPYGRAAADRLRVLIGDAKGGEPLEPVTVVVSSNYVGVATRRLLAGGALGPVCAKGSGLAAVTFLTPYRLAELLGSARLAGAGRRPVSTPVVAAALRAVLAEAPGVFAPVAAHPATETALVAAYRELRDCSAGALDGLAGAGARAADVVRIVRGARDGLEQAWYDEEDLIVSAVEALEAGGDVLGLGAVIAYLPQRLSRHEALLLAATARNRGLTVMAGTTGNARADREVRESVTALTALAGATARDGGAADDSDATVHADGAGAAPPAGAPVVDLARTRFVTTSDADDEVRVAVRAVVDAARAGTPLDRVAILYASPDPYARLLHEHLDAAGIPANGAAVTPVAARAAGRTLLGLLALPDGGFRRQDVFAWLAGAPILHDGRFAPVTAWERLSREAAVVAGVDQWDGLLTRLADKKETAATRHEADPDTPPWKAERAREEAARARALRDFVLGVAASLQEAAAAPRRWGEHARWAATLFRRLLGGPDRRGDWPKAEQHGAERVELAIARLGALDAVEGPVPLAVFNRTLLLELESDLGRIGRFGEGVLVGTVGMGVGLDLDLLVVVGLCEGTFPARPRDDSLLPDDERRSAGGELPLRRAGVDRQHRQLLAALAGANQQLLCLPRGDLRRSAERAPSRFALALAAELHGGPVAADDLLAARVAGVEHVASFDAGLRRLAFPATDTEHRLRTLLAAGSPSAAELAATADDAVVAAGAAVIAARRSGRFTRFDGNLEGLAVPSPVDRVTSTSRLEKWAACPLDYLLQHVLGVAAVENPEEALQITPIDWGNLIHGALERFIVEVLARPETNRPRPNQPWPAADRARLLALGQEAWEGYRDEGKAGRPIFWPRDQARVRAELTTFLDLDDEQRARYRTTPVAAELPFGIGPSPLAAVPLTLPDGRVVHFRGKADRVDVGEDGMLHVVDYKTGSAVGFTDLDEENPVAAGKKLQLAVYGVAARRHRETPDAPVQADYWFVSRKESFKRYGYLVTDAVLAKACTVIGTVVAGIEHGVFPAHPDPASTTPGRFGCRACDPDRLGVADLRRAWDRKRADPALAPYADLAEPLEAVAPAVVTESVDGGDDDG